MLNVRINVIKLINDTQYYRYIMSCNIIKKFNEIQTRNCF